MSATLSLTESQAMEALGTFIVSILDTSVVVVQGQANRVAPPNVTNYVVITSSGRIRLSTNIVNYDDGGAGHPGFRKVIEKSMLSVQIDVYGDNSENNAQIISSLLRDTYGADAFRDIGYDVTPLYSDDPKQIPFVNESNQYEDRWTFDAQLQLNPVVSVAQQFSDHATINPNRVR